MKNFYLLYASALFITAVVLTSWGIFEGLPPAIFAILVLAAFASCVLLRKNDALFNLFFAGLIFFAGVARYNAFNTVSEDNIKNYIFYPPREILVEGKVSSDVEESAGGRKIAFTLETRAVKSGNCLRKTNGFVLVSLYGERSFKPEYADLVALEGCIRRPFSYGRDSRFDYGKYLADKRIYCALNVKKESLAAIIGRDRSPPSEIMRAIYSFRDRLNACIEKSLAPPADSVLAAILLGKRKKIPPPLKDTFAKTGTLHILAISGLHVGIIYFALRIILKILRIGRNPSIIFSVLFLIFFAALAGSRASVVRAALMFSILAFGEMLNRKISVFNLIGLSCLLILAVNPNQAFDAGFILSYTAVLSIVGISPALSRAFRAGGPPRRPAAPWQHARYYLLKSLAVSMAVWLGLTPLVAYYFGLISPVMVIANLIVIPLAFMIIGSGLLLVFTASLSKFLGAVFAASSSFFIHALISSVIALKNIPFSYFRVKPPHLAGLIAYYILLLAVVTNRKIREKLTF